MILPLLTYSCPVQSTYTKSQLDKFSSLERRANAIINDISALPSINNQLKRECLIMVKKCVNNEFNCDVFNNYFSLINHEKNTRNNLFSIKLPRVKLEVTRRGFFFSGGSMYNNLPLAFRKIVSTNDFKNSISEYFN